MLSTITIEEAQLNLKELIDQVIAGQEILITKDGQPAARLVSELPKKKLRPAPGLGKGSIIYMASDFDSPLEDFVKRPAPGLGKGMMTIISDDKEHLKDFAEYMP